LGRNRREFSAAHEEQLPSNADNDALSERIREAFKKLGYNTEPAIVSLPRSSVASRYLKVPTQIPREIEKIVSLQASKYLPYSANELNSGFQIIDIDKDGSANLNLIIVQKETVGRFIGIFKEIKTPKLTVTLNSLGLSSLYRYLAPKEEGPVMLVDIDSQQAELAITLNQKLIFSRSFKFDKSAPHREDLFMDEINKSNSVYLKEIGRQVPLKIVFLCASRLSQELSEIIKQKTNLPVEKLFITEKVNFSQEARNSILAGDDSFAGLIGLGLDEIPEEMNLIPVQMKESALGISRRKEYLRLFLVICAIILILWLGTAKNLENKAAYLKQLKTELNAFSQEAKPLEEIEKRFRLLESYTKRGISGLDVLVGIHQAIPEQISLVSLSYDENGEIIMRGQAKELNFIFEFVSRLESSEIFKKFNIKVRYATKKKSLAGEIVDFEIACARKP
jgi:hypothetical protein